MTSVESLLKSYSPKLIEACTNDTETESVQRLFKQVEAVKSNAQIKRILLKYSAQVENSTLELLATRFYRDVNNLPKHVLQAKAEQYFEKIYPGSSVMFLEKSNGVQLGSIADVTNSIGKKIRFYIKTHRNGLLTQFSGTAKSVDLTEIFLYKLLEQIGIGPEVHFFYENHKEFFICTRDAGDVANQPNMSFVLFSKFKDSEATKQVVENVRNMNPDNEIIDENADQFMLAIVKIDILCRLFEMDDVLKNAENFGFMLNSDRIEKCCIIDFSPTSYGFNGEGVYKGFIEGNGVFLYNQDSEEAFKYIFCSRSIDKRKEFGQRAIRELGDMSKHVHTAYEFLQQLVENDAGLRTQLFILNNRIQNWLQIMDEFRELLEK